VLSPSLEDYLEEAYRLSLQAEIRVSDIARELGVSLPSTVKGLRRLSELGYLVYSPYEGMELTEKGREVGRFLVERNWVLKEFFTVLGVGADAVEEAEAVEHYLSNATIRALKNLSGFLLQAGVYSNYRSYCHSVSGEYTTPLRGEIQ